eukprot:1851831-Prymnesium_polylepis.1
MWCERRVPVPVPLGPHSAAVRAGALCSRDASRRHSHALAPPVPRGRARPARSAAARRDACAPSATHGAPSPRVWL